MGDFLQMGRDLYGKTAVIFNEEPPSGQQGPYASAKIFGNNPQYYLDVLEVGATYCLARGDEFYLDVFNF